MHCFKALINYFILSRFNFRRLKLYFSKCLNRSRIINYEFEKYSLILTLVFKFKHNSFCKTKTTIIIRRTISISQFIIRDFL